VEDGDSERQKYDKVIKKDMYRLNRLITSNHIEKEDCISFMQKMKDERVLVDVIVTSPPYNITVINIPYL
jgi:DNA modification methylase